MDKKKALLGLMAMSSFTMPDDTAYIQTPDAMSVPELFDDGSQIFNGECCARCVHRFGGSNHKYCVAHYKDKNCARFKLDI